MIIWTILETRNIVKQIEKFKRFLKNSIECTILTLKIKEFLKNPVTYKIKNSWNLKYKELSLKSVR